MGFWDLFTNERVEASLEWKPLCAVNFDPGSFCWGLCDLPLKRATENMCTIGMIGSGKTTEIRLFLQSIAPRFTQSSSFNEQLIIYDFKGNALPILDELGIGPDREDVWILNPFDERAAKWNVGAAINSPAMARYFATLLVPHEPKSTAPYFNNAARQIVCWTAIALMKIKPGDWSLRDLINALESKERMLAVCKQHERAYAVAQQHVNDKTNFGGVMSTLETKMGELHEVAALWHTSRSGRIFSLNEFFKKRGVLILGYDPVLEESIWPINIIILKALTNEILRQEDTALPRHWFVLDEFRTMQRVDCIRNLVNLGRSKGASVLLGIQSVEGLCEIYGPDATDDILQACSNKTFLRAGGARTAEWIEKHFNKVRQTELSWGVSYGPTGRSRNYNYQLHERSLFLASEFLNLPLPESGGTFGAYNDIPCLRDVVINDWRADDVFSMLKPISKIPGVKRRSNVDDESLTRWNANEELLFCKTTSPDTPLKTEEKALSRDEFASRRGISK